LQLWDAPSPSPPLPLSLSPPQFSTLKFPDREEGLVFNTKNHLWTEKSNSVITRLANLLEQ
ncbi:MAG TPA: hypothetical protein DCY91_07600, partial [Cyanobacteria bacterium UBA11370]|nr:hypothetical protein [Cyanobacteria bacterium UBA11370]